MYNNFCYREVGKINFMQNAGSLTTIQQKKK